MEPRGRDAVSGKRLGRAAIASSRAPSGRVAEGVEQKQHAEHDEDGSPDEAEAPVSAAAAPPREKGD